MRNKAAQLLCGGSTVGAGSYPSWKRGAPGHQDVKDKSESTKSGWAGVCQRVRVPPDPEWGAGPALEGEHSGWAA